MRTDIYFEGGGGGYDAGSGWTTRRGTVGQRMNDELGMIWKEAIVV
jgi:hypothetical protein